MFYTKQIMRFIIPEKNNIFKFRTTQYRSYTIAQVTKCRLVQFVHFLFCLNVIALKATIVRILIHCYCWMVADIRGFPLRVLSKTRPTPPTLNTIAPS